MYLYLCELLSRLGNKYSSHVRFNSSIAKYTTEWQFKLLSVFMMFCSFPRSFIIKTNQNNRVISTASRLDAFLISVSVKNVFCQRWKRIHVACCAMVCCQSVINSTNSLLKTLDVSCEITNLVFRRVTILNF